jgi:Protein of unknown function (DUF1153)
MFMSDQNYRTRVPHFIGADGKRVTLADLPSATHKRWFSHHKEIVVIAVSKGLLTFEEACERYSLTLDEYLAWQRTLESQSAHRLRAGLHD